MGKTCQATCFPLSTLNHWSFTEHTSWPSKPRLLKVPRWDSWAWILSQKMRWCAMSLNHGLWCLFVWIWALLGFKRDFPKIQDNVDVVRVGAGRQWNEIMWCKKFVLNNMMSLKLILLIDVISIYLPTRSGIDHVVIATNSYQPFKILFENFP